ncbi:MAG: hypothetical protein CVT70_10450 [Alphaproteobacteria bacterium HGW-Alphaproteobacteria-1]|jgi:O-antigen/teichoic acid export membrane protein|nr:MAG: hypothetical protein CVT70_10450 [Alphaproteobacteria bacterium HGW-Alphaproteobacteria-1]
MLKQTFLNALFTGVAQAISLIVFVVLAGVLETEQFGILSVQLSAAALVSIISTFQFERVYVRVRTRALKQYIAFHIRCLFLISAVLLVVSLPFAIGPSSVVLAVGMGLSQIALYAAARLGFFRRIWLMKLIQSIALLFVSALVYLTGQQGLYWLAFLCSYACAGLMVLDEPTRVAIFRADLRNDMRRFKYSLRIAAMALGSLLTGAFTREFPVLLAGAMGQPATAGTLGLVMRVVGAPLGLLARSASAVVANYVASDRFDMRAMGKLLVIPAIGTIYITLLFVASFYLPAFVKFDQFSVFLIALAPFFIVRAYVGMLGSALVFYRLQRVDLLCNTGLACFASVAGVVTYSGGLDFNGLLWIISLISIGFGFYLTQLFAKRLKEF